MVRCSTTCLAGAAGLADATINDRLKRAKEAVYRLIENGERNNELIKQNIIYLSLFPTDLEAKQLVEQIQPKLTTA